MLTVTLRRLERDALLTPQLRRRCPFESTTRLTEVGHSLLAVLTHLKAWAEHNRDAVFAARSAYDQAKVAAS